MFLFYVGKCFKIPTSMSKNGGKGRKRKKEPAQEKAELCPIVEFINKACKFHLCSDVLLYVDVVLGRSDRSPRKFPSCPHELTLILSILLVI